MSPNGKRDFYFRTYSFICYVLKNQFAFIFVEISVLIRLYGICALHHQGQEDSHWWVISSSVLSLASFSAEDTSTNISPSTRHQGAFIKNWKGSILADHNWYSTPDDWMQWFSECFTTHIALLVAPKTILKCLWFNKSAALSSQDSGSGRMPLSQGLINGSSLFWLSLF